MPRKRRHSDDYSYGPQELNYDSEEDSDDVKHPQRNAANARERARMRVLSKAFCRLKTTLPWVPADTKLSKLDTLRLATSYIAHLRAVLMDQPVSSEASHKHPLTLTWPFSFQQRGANDACPDAMGEGQGEDNPKVWSDVPLQHVARDKDISYYF